MHSSSAGFQQLPAVSRKSRWDAGAIRLFVLISGKRIRKNYTGLLPPAVSLE